jgi:hypothetical protein
LRVRLDLSDGQFQQHLCGHDIRRVQRRVSATQFGKEGGTRTLTQSPPRIAGVGIERAKTPEMPILPSYFAFRDRN